ncbi:MAG: hypothetical protein ACK5NG_02505 [Chthoniobacterales bacterium]
MSAIPSQAQADFIAETRELGRSILKPSQRDWEYGLSLHRESLVVESYSLGLHAPVQPEILNAALAEGASELEYQDLYEDEIMTGWASTPELREEYRAAWEASGVTCSFLNAGRRKQ